MVPDTINHYAALLSSPTQAKVKHKGLMGRWCLCAAAPLLPSWRHQDSIAAMVLCIQAEIRGLGVRRE